MVRLQDTHQESPWKPTETCISQKAAQHGINQRRKSVALKKILKLRPSYYLSICRQRGTWRRENAFGQLTFRIGLLVFQPEEQLRISPVWKQLIFFSYQNSSTDKLITTFNSYQRKWCNDNIFLSPPPERMFELLLHAQILHKIYKQKTSRMVFYKMC